MRGTCSTVNWRITGRRTTSTSSAGCSGRRRPNKRSYRAALPSTSSLQLASGSAPISFALQPFAFATRSGSSGGSGHSAHPHTFSRWCCQKCLFAHARGRFRDATPPLLRHLGMRAGCTVPRSADWCWCTPRRKSKCASGNTARSAGRSERASHHVLQDVQTARHCAKRRQQRFTRLMNIHDSVHDRRPQMAD